MTILELIKAVDVQIQYFTRTLSASRDGVFVVLERKRFQREPSLLYSGPDEEAAVDALLGRKDGSH